jgi:hypothetical protein
MSFQNTYTPVIRIKILKTTGAPTEETTSRKYKYSVSKIGRRGVQKLIQQRVSRRVVGKIVHKRYLEN